MRQWVYCVVECRRLNRLPAPQPSPSGQVDVWIWTPIRTKNNTCQREEELLVSQLPSISGAQLRLQMSSCSELPFSRRLVAGFALQPPQNTSFCKTHWSVWWGGAEVSSTRRRLPWVNLRQSIWVSAWNVLSLRHGDGQTEDPWCACRKWTQ